MLRQADGQRRRVPPTKLNVWPPLSPATWLRRPAATLGFPLGEPGCALFHEARQGLWHAARGLMPRGGAVLVPAYHHGSEVEALVRAGLEPRFYDGTDQLEPDPEQLDSLLDPSVGALHLIHYLGFPQDSRRWRAWCDERGLLLFEDAAQAWLSMRDGRPVGSWGDLAIFSLYKTFPVPDGGAVIARTDPPRPVNRPRVHPLQLASRQWGWVAARVPGAGLLVGRVSARVRAVKHGGFEFDPSGAFGLKNPNDPPARFTLPLLRRLFDPGAAQHRRANYRWLLARLGYLVPPPFDSVPDGASPFAFPITVNDRCGALSQLAKHGVSALDLWSVPHPLLSEDDFPGAAERRRSTIALPVHQELGEAQLARIAAAVLSVPGGPNVRAGRRSSPRHA